ncbi:hypothetical protein OXT66_00340 [Lentilactobacillus senioris]|uniref:hypothetical protein n=1 Tax=Lentilactobacillus senioris TaxID=931534 RepID=UPI002280028A|nr:hypothetical protein [Lentilactobacillus senioris]MCY9805994.1 hypothetical protein [Lentilactobacillus senioris]
MTSSKLGVLLTGVSLTLQTAIAVRSTKKFMAAQGEQRQELLLPMVVDDLGILSAAAIHALTIVIDKEHQD